MMMQGTKETGGSTAANKLPQKKKPNPNPTTQKKDNALNMNGKIGKKENVLAQE
jgi:hypothetical protein